MPIKYHRFGAFSRWNNAQKAPIQYVQNDEDAQRNTAGRSPAVLFTLLDIYLIALDIFALLNY